MTVYAFKTPSGYVQGEGVLDTLGNEVELLGSKVFIISDEVVWEILAKKIEKSFQNQQLNLFMKSFKESLQPKRLKD